MYDWDKLYMRYLKKQCSPEEVRLLLEHFRMKGIDSALWARIEEQLADNDLPVSDEPAVKAALDRIHQQLMADLDKDIVQDTERTKPLVRRFMAVWGRRVAAAALILSLAGSLYFYNPSTVNRQSSVIVDPEEVLPGTNRAVLTLADGRIVELSGDHAGIIIGDSLTYDDGSHLDVLPAMQEEGSYMQLVLTTPRGGQYQVTLPDGSRVWLNSGSTLRYPSRFTGNERVVELEGEAYFSVTSLRGGTTKQSPNSNEIASAPASGRAQRTTPHSLAMTPFLVKTNSQIVTVLGTQFNISAYTDEPETKTTLVAGTVNVTSLLSDDSRTLSPSQQSTLRGGSLDVKTVDIAPFVGWKDGLFSFHETELRTVMKQLSRWYDVTVEYNGDIIPTHYYGYISRDESLAKVLELLKESGLSFKVEKINDTNKLIVLP